MAIYETSRGGAAPKVKGNRAKPRPKTKAKTKAGKPKTPADTTTFNQPLNDRTLAEQVAAQTALAYGGQEQALAGQRAVGAQMQRNIPAWYQDYQNALAQATQQTGGAYAGALGAQATTAATSSALDAQQRAALNTGMQQDAATRGATVDPAIAAQGQQAAASRRSQLDQFAGLTAGQGAAQVAFGANRQVVGAGQKLTAQLAEAQRGRNLDVAGRQLAGEKGQYAATARQKLIDTEHTKQLENAAFGLEGQKAQLDAANKQATLQERRRARVTSNRNADESRQISQGHLTEQQRHNQTQEKLAAARLKGTGGLSPAEVQRRRREGAKIQADIDTATSDAKSLRSGKIPVRTPDGKVEMDKDGKPTQRTRAVTESEIRSALRKKYKDRDIANAAMDLALNGYVSPVNQRRLKARGVNVPKGWLTGRPKLKPVPAPNR